jgi:SAM-dependent methyltransferase
MLRYCMASMTLKTLSVGPGPRLYRRLANVLGGARREAEGRHPAYVERANLLINVLQGYGMAQPGMKVLEIGTGWVHWYGLVLRMAYDCQIDLLDVVDNRQLASLRRHFQDVPGCLQLPRGRTAQAEEIARRVRNAADFENLYRQVGARYLLRPTGAIDDLASAAYDGIVSFHVFEHLRRESVPSLLDEYCRVLKPGGFSVHQIGIDDHLRHYDESVHPKQYLRYSDKTWKLLFENRIQYFNRLQRNQWLEDFRVRGFKLLHEERESSELDGLRVAAQYTSCLPKDLECTILTIVHRKDSNR